MDTKNVIAAISLSAAVIILYSLFWAPSPQELKKVKDNDDLELLKSKTEQLVQSSLKLGEAIYKSQQKNTDGKGPQQNQGAKEKDQSKENVVDADFEEVKEDKDKDKDKEKRA